MSSGVTAFLTGLMSGGMQGYELRRKWDQEKEERQQKQEKHSLEVGKLRREAEIAKEYDDLAQRMAPGGQGNALAPAQASDAVAAPASTAPVSMPQVQARPLDAPAAPEAGGWMPPGLQPSGAQTHPVQDAISRLQEQSRQAKSAQAQATAPATAAPAASAAAPAAASAPAAPPGVAGLGMPGGLSAATPAIGQPGDGFEHGHIINSIMKPSEYNQQLGALALRTGNFSQAGALFEKAEQQRNAREDMDFGLRVLRNQDGEDAKGLMAFVSQQSVPGVKAVQDEKTGVTFLQVVNEQGGVDSMPLTGNNLLHMAIAVRKLQRGDPSALEDLAAVNKGLAAAVAASYTAQQSLAEANNKARKQQYEMEQAALSGQLFADIVRKRGGTQAEIAAARAGVLKPSLERRAGDGEDKVRWSASNVSHALGEPVRDQFGNTTYEVKPERMDAFLNFVKMTGATDDQAALPKFLAHEADLQRLGDIPGEDIARLHANPGLAKQFNQTFGPGMAELVLQMRR